MDGREGYREEFVREQIERASNLDWTVLIDQECRRSNHKKDQIPMIVTFHPAICSLRDVVGRLQTILGASEEHRRAIKEKPSVVFRRAPNLKDSLVRTSFLGFTQK